MPFGFADIRLQVHLTRYVSLGPITPWLFLWSGETPRRTQENLVRMNHSANPGEGVSVVSRFVFRDQSEPDNSVISLLPLPIMPHPIVEIDELLRLVVEELVEISPRTVASFAVTCRSLEEPVLSSLWKHQSSLCTLVMVLPQHRSIGFWNECSLVSWCNFPSGHLQYSFPPGG